MCDAESNPNFYYLIFFLHFYIQRNSFLIKNFGIIHFNWNHQKLNFEARNYNSSYSPIKHLLSAVIFFILVLFISFEFDADLKIIDFGLTKDTE